MSISLTPQPASTRSVTDESLALSRWYDSQPAIRRLWGVKHGGQLRVTVAIEPTHDGDELYPLWLANADAWTRELHLSTGLPVQLKLVDDSCNCFLESDGDGVVVVDLCWRNAT